MRETGLEIVRPVNTMPFVDGEFAAILSRDVLYHRNVNGEKICCAEYHRCLQKTGIYCCKLAAFQWMASAHDEHVRCRLNVAQLRALLPETGFEIVNVGIGTVCCFPLMMLQRPFRWAKQN